MLGTISCLAHQQTRNHAKNHLPHAWRSSPHNPGRHIGNNVLNRGSAWLMYPTLYIKVWGMYRTFTVQYMYCTYVQSNITYTWQYAPNHQHDSHGGFFPLHCHTNIYKLFSTFILGISVLQLPTFLKWGFWQQYRTFSKNRHYTILWWVKLLAYFINFHKIIRSTTYFLCLIKSA
jgi:hypothetical protein